MKIKDIPQFPHASYTVNVSWSYLREWLQDHKVILDPIYQRGYVWTEFQKIAYLEYMLRGGFSGKDIFWNSPGWLRHGAGILELVDGKQRIRAVSEFLDNKVKAFDHYYNEFEDKLHFVHPDFIFHVNNLETEKEVVQWYLGLNTGGSIHTAEDLKFAQDHLKSLI